MEYLIKVNNEWYLFNNVPSNYTRFELKNGPQLICGKDVIEGEQLFFATDEIENWITHSVVVNRQMEAEDAHER